MEYYEYLDCIDDDPIWTQIELKVFHSRSKGRKKSNKTKIRRRYPKLVILIKYGRETHQINEKIERGYTPPWLERIIEQVIDDYAVPYNVNKFDYFLELLTRRVRKTLGDS